ncbi:MAG: hypothetical protein A4E57_02809 [Syntrophorhabdaceae bacterium PtaU1.Bin034]|jgi:hypothetical protein|nr:MAG: hypothetical protein A4E57_02809 [Syntrophorhabdaceae bacterium PtaU1.Bin034]
MSEERDRFLTEAMGECFHDIDLGKPVFSCKGGGFVCPKCEELVVSNNYFSTREDFARLWQWVSKQEGLGSFFSAFPADTIENSDERNRFADGLYKLLKITKGR